jgi:hypothetical protein
MIVLFLRRRGHHRGAQLERLDDLYASAQVSWTVIHHACSLALPVRALLVGVISSAFRALLVTPTGAACRLVSRSSLAPRSAVAVAPITMAAQEEDLLALRPAADDET